MEKYITNNKVLYHPERVAAWQKQNDINPVSVELHISNKCNNACYYCGRQAKDADIMDEDRIFEAIDYISWINAKSITFTGGGEPTLNPALDQAIRYTRKKELDIGIITNGINLHNDIILTILAFAKWIRISLDAVDKNLYSVIRGVDKSEKVIDNIQALLALRSVFNNNNCTIGIQIVVNKYNHNRIVETANEILKKMPGIDYISIRPIETRINEDPYTKDELNIIFEQLPFLETLRKVIISNKWDLFTGNKSFGFSLCQAADFIGVVDVKGDFYPCCHVINRPEYRVLNVFDDITRDFLEERQNVFKMLNNKGFNPEICPVACRGSQINIALERFLNENHKNFL